MVNSGLQTLLCSVALCGTATGVAEDEEVPDMEFLEYLGMWEETDEDWLLLDEEEVVSNDERTDPVPQGKESTETEDES